MDASIAPQDSINRVPVPNLAKDAIVGSINLNKSRPLALRVKLAGTS
jgi:hypothetical protein